MVCRREGCSSVRGGRIPDMKHPCAVLLCALAVSSAASAVDDEAPPVGMNIVPLVKAAAEAISPKDPPLPGRAWSDDLAALTDPDPAVNGPAVGRLARRGAVVLPDLAILASERDWQLRARIVRVAAGIGGEEGAELTLRLSRDNDPRIRRLAIVGLGRCRGEAVLTRLLEQVASLDGDERAMAASALSAFGDARAIEPLTKLRADPDGPARAAQAKTLRELCSSQSAAETVVQLLGRLAGEQRRALLEALDGCVDARLCPALAKLVGEREALIALLAVRALATAGDARAVEPLAKLAASERLPELREAAAATLRVLTPYHAGPGQAWALWWKDNAARYAKLAERDALIAQLADLASPIPAALAEFSTEELLPLIDAAIVTRPVPAWLPGRALAALRAQAGERWIQPLAQLIDNAPDAETRLDLILLLDEIGGPEAKGELQRQQELLAKREADALARWKKDGVIPPDMGAERLLLAMALGHR